MRGAVGDVIRDHGVYRLTAAGFFDDFGDAAQPGGFAAVVVGADHVRVVELAIGAARVVVQLVLNALEASGFEVVDVGAVAQAGHAITRLLQGHVHEDEVVDPGVKVRHFGTYAVAVQEQAVFEDVDAHFPGGRGLWLEERVGVGEFCAPAMGPPADHGFGHGRWAPALAVSGEQLHPVQARLDRQAEGGREAALLFVNVVVHRLTDLFGGPNHECSGFKAGLAAQPVTVVAQARVHVEPVVVVVIQTREQAGHATIALGCHVF